MNGIRARKEAANASRWMIHLPCGHEIGVPWGSAVPAQMACVVRHQSECLEPRDDWTPSWWAPPLDHLDRVEGR